MNRALPSRNFSAMAALFFFALLTAHGRVLAQGQGLTGSFDVEFEERPWAQFASKLPKFPEPADLVEIHVEGEHDTKFLIDLASVDLGSDAVVRFTMLTRSATGTESLTYEGLRCSSAERKLYALGRSDRSWGKATYARWGNVMNRNINSYHAALYREYFCQKRAPLASRQLIVDTIKRGGLPPETHY